MLKITSTNYNNQKKCDYTPQMCRVHYKWSLQLLHVTHHCNQPHAKKVYKEKETALSIWDQLYEWITCIGQFKMMEVSSMDHKWILKKSLLMVVIILKPIQIWYWWK